MTEEKPILFQGDMVRAILAGRKTQTRRIFKVTDPLGGRHAIRQPEKVIQLGRPGDLDDFHYESTGALSGPYPCPYGQPGHRLRVRESYHFPNDCDNVKPSLVAETVDIWYAAGGQRQTTGGLDWGRPMGRCRPGIHIPDWATRLRLDITGVRCEPLQAISEADALAEGFKKLKATGRIVLRDGGQHFGEYWHTARAAYRDLWDSINGLPAPVYKKGEDGKKYISHYVSYPWEDKWEQAEHKGKMHVICGNPWVWVLEFNPFLRAGRETYNPIQVAA